MVITHLLNGMILQAWYFRGIILRILDIRWCFLKHFLLPPRRRSKRSFSMSVASACRDTTFFLGGQRCRMVRGYTPLQTNSLHLKMDGWNTIVSSWDGSFSWAMFLFREGTSTKMSPCCTYPTSDM